MPEILKFDLPRQSSSIIKVIGVGGGGSNAVTHMHRQGIKGVDFIICNTDGQALESSPVPSKIQLGANLTGGLGAGAVPSMGRNAALENIDDIRDAIGSNTKMLFITAGMGGGTGTGAAPVIAQVAREQGILTVGIVTIPFSFEGRKRRQHADEGISEMKQYVDALLIISNDKLRELYGDLRLSAAFGHADNVLTTAAKGIAEIITVTGYINVDFEDVKTVMKDSGVAIMGTGIAGGENRAQRAVEMALASPLLNNSDIEGASNILLYIASGKEEITMDEVTDITDYIHGKTKFASEVIWGNGYDENLEDMISVTIIATGFDDAHRRSSGHVEKFVKVMPLYENPEIRKPETGVMPQLEPVAAVMEEEQPLTDETAKEEISLISFINKEVPEILQPEPEKQEEAQREIIFEFSSTETRQNKESVETSSPKPAMTGAATEKMAPVSEIRNIPVPEEVPAQVFKDPDFDRRHNDRVQKLKSLSEKLKNHQPIENTLYELEATPAYKRRNVELSDIPSSDESHAPKYTLGDNADQPLEQRSENSYLHNKPD